MGPSMRAEAERAHALAGSRTRAFNCRAAARSQSFPSTEACVRTIRPAAPVPCPCGRLAPMREGDACVFASCGTDRATAYEHRRQ
eukprot:3828767-Pleurochrysis_carterae.AAC.1